MNPRDHTAIQNIAEMKTQSETCKEILGRVGRMIAYSKSSYRRQFPNNVVTFNACVCTKAKGKIWHGDLDVTRDGDLLKTLARALGETVYVLHESDARLEDEWTPRLHNARAIISQEEVKVQEQRC